LPIADGGHDVTSVRLEQPGDALPQEEEVFGNDNAHGTSITTMVGPPLGLLTARIPSNAASRRSVPASPVPLAGSAPPTPSSSTSARSIPFSWVTRMRIVEASACLAALFSASATAK